MRVVGFLLLSNSVDIVHCMLEFSILFIFSLLISGVFVLFVFSLSPGFGDFVKFTAVVLCRKPRPFLVKLLFSGVLLFTGIEVGRISRTGTLYLTSFCNFCFTSLLQMTSFSF
uniref:Uncharacterized protein n=1 Tax=Cacopsylla melanoneura TaxID=428564 RepID=A0A8D8ZAC9_9HEMI